MNSESNVNFLITLNVRLSFLIKVYVFHDFVGKDSVSLYFKKIISIKEIYLDAFYFEVIVHFLYFLLGFYHFLGQFVYPFVDSLLYCCVLPKSDKIQRSFKQFVPESIVLDKLIKRWSYAFIVLNDELCVKLGLHFLN